MRFWFTVVIMLVLIGSAHRFGRGPERWGAHLLGGNLFLSILNHAIWMPTFQSTDYSLAVIDGLTLAGLTWMAVRANRVWPLVIAGLQLVVVITHASVLVAVGWTQVYYGMMALSQYVALIVLALGIQCHHHRERRIGRYREWRPGYEPEALRFETIIAPANDVGLGHDPAMNVARS